MKRFGPLHGFSAFAFEAANHNLLRKSSKGTPTKFLTEVLSKRFLRDFYTRKGKNISVGEFVCGELKLRGLREINGVPVGHPLDDGVNYGLLKCAQSLRFKGKSLYCHASNCNFVASRNCFHFLSYAKDGEERVGRLNGIIFREYSADVVLTVLRYETRNVCLSMKSGDPVLEKALRRIDSLPCIVSEIVRAVNVEYLSVAQIEKPCVAFSNGSRLLCVQIVSFYEHD